MASQYEIEHGIKPTDDRRRRQVDMSSFTSHLHQISTSSPLSAPEGHNNPHATATPVDMAALFRLVQDQMELLARDAPSGDNESLLRGMIEALQDDIANPPAAVPGVSQEYLDSLDRVPRKRLGQDEACPICAERYLDDEYCLVVELPCHHSHRFDLECVGPWLLSKGTCPLCRKDLTKKKEPVIPVDDDDEEDYNDGLYS
ncbi:Zinc finger, RING/FYVE/PHD-type [Pleurostoma richardsiae]|uniref:Zinc finger, RING/FYVE/PHD-type n=1 Tax=Pleurostoma richardsiae TaxID=41990 RepID=A0AA38VHE1_9PEZI|nr:Zinc finger, RING/FYVE/PHD-type [Pleurostoma richardsiae]